MIRRAFLSAINYSHPQRGMLHALRGIFGPENVAEYDYFEASRKGLSVPEINRAFTKAAIAFRPDWIFLQVQDSNLLQIDSVAEIRKALPKCVISHWTGDLRTSVSPYLSGFCKMTHLTLISSVGQIPMFKAAGAQEVQYCQIGLDWEEDVLGIPLFSPPFQVPEVVLCGNYYGGSNFPGTMDRELGITALLEAGVRVGIVGRGWPPSYPVFGECKVKEQHHVWKRAKIGLNINHYNNIEQYYSDRQLISMAYGTPVVCRHIPGLEREFTNRVHCFWYGTETELVDHVARLLGDEETRLRVGACGRAEVIRNHTWFSRFLDLMPEVEKIQSEL